MHKEEQDTKYPDVRNSKRAKTVQVEMPAQVVEKDHQNSDTAQQIKVRGGSSAYCAIGH